MNEHLIDAKLYTMYVLGVEVRRMYHLPHVHEYLGRSSKNELDVGLGDAAALVSQRT